MKQRLVTILLTLLCVAGVKAENLDYFALTAHDGDVRILVQSQNGSEEEDAIGRIEQFLQYSTDKSNWTTIAYEPDPNSAPEVFIGDGKTVYFRACEKRTTLPIRIRSGYSSVDIESEASYLTASGNIMSLLDPDCSSMELGKEAFCGLFFACRKLKSAKDLKLPALTLAEGCYEEMFMSCEKLEEAPELPATTLAPYCYKKMFAITNVTSVTLGAIASSYANSFEYWTDSDYGTFYITKELSYGNVDHLYSGFNRNWVVVPLDTEPDYFTLTACYGEVRLYLDSNDPERMENVLQYSYDKINWTNVGCGRLNVNSYAEDIIRLYAGQPVYFRACSKRKALPFTFKSYFGEDFIASGNVMSLLDPTCFSTELGEKALNGLFWDCTYLKSAKDLKLPAMTLTESCYANMFRNCRYLEDAPLLPATTLAPKCYDSMFEITSVKSITLGATSITDASSFEYWVTGSGTIYILPELDEREADKQLLVSKSGRWTTEVYSNDYFALTAKDGLVGVEIQYTDPSFLDEQSIEYSRNRNYWEKATPNKGQYCTLPLLSSGQTYYFRRGTTNVAMQFSTTDPGAGTLEASGNIMSLVDPTMQSTEVPDGAFSRLFLNSLSLISAEHLKLPATKVGDGSYQSMFSGCKNLTAAPALPATELGTKCYSNMFRGCKKITKIELGATDISDNDCLYYWLDDVGYEGMLYIKEELADQISKLNLPSGWGTSKVYVHANEDPDNKGNYYATYYDSKYSWVVSTDGAMAYTGEVLPHMNGTEVDYLYLAMSPTESNAIPNDCAVIIRGTTPKILLTLAEEECARPKSNALIGTDFEIGSNSIDNYIMTYGKDGLGFYRYGTGTLAAHKAYLNVDSSSSAKAITMVFDDGDATGVSSVIENNDGSNVIYNLSGQRIDRLQRGINIVNGKKVFIK